MRSARSEDLADVMPDADVFLGVRPVACDTGDGARHGGRRSSCAGEPEPEIRRSWRASAGGMHHRDGRSDYANQVNNVLCFPYIFRGALDCGATRSRRR